MSIFGKEGRRDTARFYSCYVRQKQARVAIYKSVCRKFVTVSIFTILDGELQFIYNNYSGVERNNDIR